MNLNVILFFHVLVSLVCLGRWSLSPIKLPLFIAALYVLAGVLMGWIPMWPDSQAMSWFLTILMVLIEVLWVSWNFREAEDSCIDKTVIFYEPEELKRYAPGSE